MGKQKEILELTVVLDQVVAAQIIATVISILLMPLPLAAVKIQLFAVLCILVDLQLVQPFLMLRANLVYVMGAELISLSMEGRLTVISPLPGTPTLHAQDVEVLISALTVDVVALGVQDPPTVIFTQQIGLPPVAAMILLPHVPTVPDL